MEKRIGVFFILIGLGFSSWNIWQMWSQKQGVEYNLAQARSVDPKWNDKTIEEFYKGKENKTNEKDYSFKTGDKVAELTVPKLGSIFSIYWGTDTHTLKKGVGMYDTRFTTLPPEHGHTALAGHRDTVFWEMGELNVGDRLYITFDNVEYEYQIRDIWVTHKEDRTVIVPKDKPTLTLTTCYPFDYIGSAPDRYIIQSDLVDKKPAAEQDS